MTNQEKQNALVRLAAESLNGMLSNPEWMIVAKKDAGKPDRGDIPEQFARLACIYAERTLDKLIDRNNL